jgi:hypothetical protein
MDGSAAYSQRGEEDGAGSLDSRRTNLKRKKLVPFERLNVESKRYPDVPQASQRTASWRLIPRTSMHRELCVPYPSLNLLRRPVDPTNHLRRPFKPTAASD